LTTSFSVLLHAPSVCQPLPGQTDRHFSMTQKVRLHPQTEVVKSLLLTKLPQLF
jgi:hypothetical protein